MKLIVFAVLLVHGLIHAMGVAKAYGLATLEQLSLPISRGWGVVWGACAVLFVASAVARLSGAGWWWMIAAPALVASQVVIVVFWTDARAGTVLNVVLLVPVLVGAGRWSFDAGTASEVRRLQASVQEGPGSIVELAELDALPRPVQDWLRRAGIPGRPRARAIHVTQHGSLQQSPDGRWMPFRAEQWFAVTSPGFVWAAQVRGPAGTGLAVRDRFIDGSGSMRGELLSLIPVVRASGPTIDQGALVRFLAETMWFPSAALEPYLRWEPIDDSSARAIISHRGLEADGVFHFDARGDVVGFEARRYREDRLEDWLIVNEPDSFAELDGVRVPTRSTVTWRNQAGDTWTWLRLSVDAVQRDR